MTTSNADLASGRHRLPVPIGSESAKGLLPLDVQLWIEVLALIILGLVMVFSASFIMSFQKTGDAAYYVKRQFLWIVFGLATMITVSRIHYRRYKSYARLILLASLASLVLVAVPSIGVKLNNARRWISFGAINLQPAEFAKVAWIIFLSSSLAAKQERIKKIAVGLLPHMFWCGVFALLLLLEPDFGTTFMISLLTMIMLFTGGVPVRQLIALAPLGFAGFYRFVYHVPYRWERITAFFESLD